MPTRSMSSTARSGLLFDILCVRRWHCDLTADLHHWVEGDGRFLEHHRDARAADVLIESPTRPGAEDTDRRTGSPATTVAPVGYPRMLQRHRLARSRFADEPHGSPASRLRHVVEDPMPSGLSVDVDGEGVHFEDRHDHLFGFSVFVRPSPMSASAKDTMTTANPGHRMRP